MTRRQTGPFPYSPIASRPPIRWPNGAQLALWVNPNVEFFALDDVMPTNTNERSDKARAHVPNVRNWSVRDYGNRVGIWRFFEVLSRYGIRGSAALNSDVCEHHPEVIAEMQRLDWEMLGHGRSNATRLPELSPDAERDEIVAALDHIERATGTRPLGWLSPGLAETWDTLHHLADAGIGYVCDWVNDDQPYRMDLGDSRTLVALPYSVQINDVPAYFDFKVSVPEFEEMITRQFDVLYREGEQSGRVMAIAIHPFVSGQPHRIVALERALEYICSHPGVWLATGHEIVEHYLQQTPSTP